MKPRIFFVKPNESPFTKVDSSILQSHFPLKSINLGQSRGKLHYLWSLCKLFLKILANPSPTLVAVWFADYHAAVAVLAARLRGFKSVVFIGGFDAVCYPEFNYGAYCSKLRSATVRYALKRTNLIIANHASLLQSSNTYYNPEGHPEGIFNLIPSLKTPAIVIHNAITIEAPETLSLQQERKIDFLCVGGTPRYNDTYNKGFDLIAAFAKQNPQYTIHIIGLKKEFHDRFRQEHSLEKTTNLILHDRLSHRKVLQMLGTTRFYLQPSISEGMPNALMEAMVLGCMPIGSDVAGIPTLIGEYGVVFTQRDVGSFSRAISKAQNLKYDPHEKSQWMQGEFSLEKRAEKLIQAIKSIYSQD